MPSELIIQNTLLLICLTHQYLISLLVKIFLVNTGFSEVISFMASLQLYRGYWPCVRFWRLSPFRMEAHVNTARLDSKQTNFSLMAL